MGRRKEVEIADIVNTRIPCMACEFCVEKLINGKWEVVDCDSDIYPKPKVTDCALATEMAKRLKAKFDIYHKV